MSTANENPYAEPKAAQRSDEIERRRGFVKGLTGAGLIILILALIANREPDLVASVAPSLVGDTFDQRVFFGMLALALGLVMTGRWIWKCAHCRSWIGPYTASHCRSCGKAIVDYAPLPGGGFAEPGSAPAPLNDTAVDEFQKTLRRLIRIDRLRRTTLLLAVAAVVTVVSSIAALLFHAFKDPELFKILVPVVFFGTWVLLRMIGQTVKNFALIALRCPGCRKNLANNLATFCPHCGVAIPLLPG